jgi:hypothetical protein
MGTEFIFKMIEEARSYIEKEDTVQASEKLYKASEETLKILAKKYDLPEYKDAEEKGRWTVSLLFNAVRRLSEMVDSNILDFWDHAWFLHVEGFHEARLSLGDVKVRAKFIDEFVKLVK